MQSRRSLAMLTVLLSAGVLAAAVHCGGRAQGGAVDASGDATAQAEASAGGDAGGGDVCVGPCSPTQPEAGSACTVEGLQCEYGGGLLLECNAVLVCDGGAWTPQIGGFCNYAPFADAGDAGCPATWSGANGFLDSGMCPALDCEYAEGYCACLTYCLNGGQAPGPRPPPRRRVTVTGMWDCRAAAPPCALPRPLLGTPCDTDASCDYGWTCGCGDHQSCVQGVWQGVPFPACG
jgi:hypothetical protein